MADSPRLSDWRGRFPASVGAPSWVMALSEDNLVGNVAFLAQRVDHVQILCFGKDYVDELLPPRDVQRLAALREGGLRFTIHLPADLALLDPNDDLSATEAKAGQIGHVQELCRPLGPERLILHLDPAPADSAHLERVLDCLLDHLSPLHPDFRDSLLIENTTWDLVPFMPALRRRGLGICADFGHLWHQGLDIGHFLDSGGSSIRELHLHGFDAQADHLPLDAIIGYPDSPGCPLAAILGFLETHRPSVTIENFRVDWLEQSLACLARHWSHA